MIQGRRKGMVLITERAAREVHEEVTSRQHEPKGSERRRHEDWWTSRQRASWAEVRQVSRHRSRSSSWEADMKEAKGWGEWQQMRSKGKGDQRARLHRPE